ncbi:CinA family protein [Leucobacter chromiireducens]|uniref:CinA family protein n=1 Tax=Leucobacter chromiireducens TaxID=283877 RepID=UPI001F14C9F1|nr:CinA family protein [Leucobacter chromiireducens]
MRAASPSPRGGAAVAAANVVARAAAAGIRIAVAESLTGGALADALVSVPGASRVFSGAIVAYDTELKASLLGVDRALLRRTGPVDREVAMQMASGVRRACATPRVAAGGRRPSESRDAEIGLATTGVAGPDPDPQTGQPVGTVWLGLSFGTRTTAIPLLLAGDRAEIRASTVHAALDALDAALVREYPGFAAES